MSLNPFYKFKFIAQLQTETNLIFQDRILKPADLVALCIVVFNLEEQEKQNKTKHNNLKINVETVLMVCFCIFVFIYKNISFPFFLS